MKFDAGFGCGLSDPGEIFKVHWKRGHPERRPDSTRWTVLGAANHVGHQQKNTFRVRVPLKFPPAGGQNPRYVRELCRIDPTCSESDPSLAESTPCLP